MNNGDHFLSCDWGTTNFRLRLVSLPDLNVEAEVSSGQGVSVLDKSWKEQDRKAEEARYEFYQQVLIKSVADLEAKAGKDLRDLQIVISGMATSSIGLINLPYRKLPVGIDGADFDTHRIPAKGELPHELLLISGLQGDDDVMRGEETQLIGCLTPEMEALEEEQLIIHPGTHSKHITVLDKQITGFRTYMSGELFRLFSTHGILRDNVAASDWQEGYLPAFLEGVKTAQQEPLLHAAFTVRTGDLFRKRSKEENYYYLSGILIGTELESLRKSTARWHYLCCGAALIAQYSAALDALGLPQHTEVLPPEWEAASVVRGQAKVLRQQSL